MPWANKLTDLKVYPLSTATTMTLVPPAHGVTVVKQKSPNIPIAKTPKLVSID